MEILEKTANLIIDYAKTKDPEVKKELQEMIIHNFKPSNDRVEYQREWKRKKRMEEKKLV